MMKTKKRTPIITLCSTGLLIVAVAVYAIASLFYTKSNTSDFSKGTIFQFDLDTSLTPTEVLPGDSFTVKPVITNDATEDMYVFIAVDTPSVENSSLYEYNVGDGWTTVESSADRTVYAYANSSSMTALGMEESTEALTTQMTMKNISNAEYAGIDDINIIITGYAIGTEDVGTSPSDAWTYCKQVGDIQ